jgi:hypothetical protein
MELPSGVRRTLVEELAAELWRLKHPTLGPFGWRSVSQQTRWRYRARARAMIATIETLKPQRLSSERAVEPDA